MKANILSPQLEISPRSALGGTVTDREILYRLADRGHNITILLPEGQEYKEHPMIKVKTIPRNFMLKRSYTANLFFLKYILKTIKEERIDILRVHSPYSIGMGVSLLKLFKQLPPVWFSFLHLHKRLDWYLLDKVLPHFADGVTALSNDTLSDLKMRFKWIDKKINRVTPLGIDANIFYRVPNPDLKELEDKTDIDLSKPLVLFVGRLTKEKGVNLLLDSWRMVSQRHNDVQLLIIGRGALQKSVREFCQSNKRVYHLSYVSQNRLRNYYSAASIFVLPTFKEGFGMVVGEAMACQVPVVVTKALGVRDLVLDGKTGFLVNIGDSAQLSQKVLCLLDDNALSIKMGKAAAERVKDHFSWEKAIDRSEEFINEVLTRAKR